jgi:heme/copper-type cytochrome/quinol oxidase subunit 4
MKINIIREATETKDGYYLLFEDPVYPIKEINDTNNLIIKNDTNIPKCNFNIGSTSYYIENENDLQSLQKTNTYFIYMIGFFSLTIILFIIFIIIVLIYGFDNITSLLMLLFIIILLGISLWVTFLYLNNKKNEIDILSPKTLNCIDDNAKK